MLVECRICAAVVDGIVVGTYDDNFRETESRTTFLKCPICSAPFLVTQTREDGKWSEPYQGWPPIEKGFHYAIPEPIGNAFDEARACYRARAYTGVVLLCRKVVEGIVAHYSITGKSLAAALKEMRDRGIIENRLYEWADMLRIAGNEAAHDVHTVMTISDALDTLEFTSALLEYVFTFQEKFKHFKERRSNKAPAPSPSD